MNKLFMLAILSLATSTAAFANRCEVQLVDNYGRLLDRIISNDSFQDCKEGMKTCRLEIRKRNLLNRADCVRSNSNDQRPVPGPTPHPMPRPMPQPMPMPQPERDSVRFIENGENVIMNSQYYRVVGSAMDGTYAIQANDIWKTVTSGVRRKNLSTTKGCSLDLCVGNQVINLKSLEYQTIAGLSFDQTFVVQRPDIWKTLVSNTSRDQLAMTEGCIYGHYNQQLCVGNQVISRNNQYSTVAGIQIDGRVVLRGNDIWKTLKANVDPMDLVITR